MWLNPSGYSIIRDEVTGLRGRRRDLVSGFGLRIILYSGVQPCGSPMLVLPYYERIYIYSSVRLCIAVLSRLSERAALKRLASDKSMRVIINHRPRTRIPIHPSLIGFTSRDSCIRPCDSGSHTSMNIRTIQTASLIGPEASLYEYIHREHAEGRNSHVIWITKPWRFIRFQKKSSFWFFFSLWIFDGRSMKFNQPMTRNDHIGEKTNLRSG